jgi:endonuclease YncB( thermonuclease family)
VSLNRPRRLFRDLQDSSLGQTSFGRTLLAGILGTFLGAIVVLTGLPSDLFGRVPNPSGSLSADAAEVAVVDGDTLRLRDTIIRLQGVEAPPRGRSCSRADGSSFDCGAAAVAALAGLVRGHTVVCHITSRDGAGFIQAMCDAGETDLNRHLVADGWARARADVPAFSDEEARARTEQRGLWHGAVGF